MLLSNIADKYFVFKPSKNYIGTPKDVGLDFDDLYFDSTDNVTLHGWFVNNNSDKTILWLHGNGGNISHRINSLKNLSDNIKSNIFIFDYRGYGKSGGNVSETGCYQDSLSAVTFLQETYLTRTDQLVLFGKSLGCAIATEIAIKVNPLALLLESPFTSIREMVKYKFPYIPGVQYLISDKFNTYKKIDDIHCPVMIIHGDSDMTIPQHMGKTVYNKYKHAKLFLNATNAGHNNIEEVLGERYYLEIESFLKSNSQ